MNTRMLKDGMLLYHGSYMPIESIDLDKCSHGRDFGKGFYLTSSVNQARNFIKTSLIKAQRAGLASLQQKEGYVSSFRYREKDGIQTYQFSGTDREWLWFVTMNRLDSLKPLLKERLPEDAFRAEIVIGKVANDQTNPTIIAYTNGIYGNIESEKAVAFAIDQLMPNKLDDQYCFLSERAVSCLEFQEARRYVI